MNDFLSPLSAAHNFPKLGPLATLLTSVVREPMTPVGPAGVVRQRVTSLQPEKRGAVGSGEHVRRPLLAGLSVAPGVRAAREETFEAGGLFAAGLYSCERLGCSGPF